MEKFYTNTNTVEYNFDKMTADEILEEGLGLIARGLFRLAKNDKSEAYSKSLTLLRVLSDISYDFNPKKAIMYENI